LSQVLTAIADCPEIIVAQRPWGTVVNYMMITGTTFPEVVSVNDAIRREGRGMIFCPNSGRIVRRPLHKFWNINEKSETQLENLRFDVPHAVYTKMDGSMLAPFEVQHGSGIVRWGTRMGITDVALAAEEFVKNNPNYQSFAEWCISQDITPIFEFTSPGQYKIVVDYDKPMMTLLAARHMITGEYLSLSCDDSSDYQHET
jgi:RNA ligase